MDFTEFWTICSINGIILDDEMSENIKRFHRELVYWNQKVNLISRQDVDFILEKHILHSLVILKYEKISYKARLMDVGCGAGFPGTILKIARPDIFLTLVDSISKKLKIAEMLARHTSLRNIQAFAIRVEELSNNPDFRSKFDYITARAVSSTSNLIQWTRDLLKPTGKIILLKGGDLQKEILEANKKFPEFEITEQIIELRGFDYFTKENKKIVIITKKIR